LCYTRPMPPKRGIEPTSARSNNADAIQTITSTRYVRQDGNDGVNVALTWQLVQGLSGAWSSSPPLVAAAINPATASAASSATSHTGAPAICALRCEGVAARAAVTRAGSTRACAVAVADTVENIRLDAAAITAMLSLNRPISHL